MMDAARDREFFLMSVDAINALQEELLAVVGPQLSGSVLFRFGFKSGHRSAEQMFLSAQGDGAMQDIDQAWIEMGFARPVSVNKENGGLDVILSETLESTGHSKGKCNFTRGFLAGLVSCIYGVPYFCEESECVSRGAETCRFRLIEREKEGGTKR